MSDENAGFGLNLPKAPTPDDPDGLIGEIVSGYEKDELKTGVLAAVIDANETLAFIKSIALCIRKSEELGRACYVVRSGNKLYATNTPPIVTTRVKDPNAVGGSKLVDRIPHHDLNALYVVKVAPPKERDDLTQRFYTALRAMVGRL